MYVVLSDIENEPFFSSSILGIRENTVSVSNDSIGWITEIFINSWCYR